MAKAKGKFQVGQLVYLPVRIIRVDRRYKPTLYRVEGAVARWVMDDEIGEQELSTAREICPRPRMRGK